MLTKTQVKLDSAQNIMETPIQKNTFEHPIILMSKCNEASLMIYAFCSNQIRKIKA